MRRLGEGDGSSVDVRVKRDVKGAMSACIFDRVGDKSVGFIPVGSKGLLTVPIDIIL